MDNTSEDLESIASTLVSLSNAKPTEEDGTAELFMIKRKLPASSEPDVIGTAPWRCS